jgi:hypothetical protein
MKPHNYDIFHISSSDEDNTTLDGKAGDSSSSSEDDLQLPVRYSPYNQKNIDAGYSRNKPNYSSLKKKTISENQHTVVLKNKRGPVFYQNALMNNDSSNTQDKKKVSSPSVTTDKKKVSSPPVNTDKKINTPIFYQDTGAKSEDTSSTTSSSSDTTSEEEISKKPLSNIPVIDKSLLSTPFMGISLSSSPMNNLFMKKLDSKLNYNDNIIFNASDSGNAFDEKIKKNISSPPPQQQPKANAIDNETYNIYLLKSAKTAEVLKNLSIPYHCHIKGMCKGPFSDKNKKVHQLEMTDNTTIMDIQQYIYDNNVMPFVDKDDLSMVLFTRKFSDFEEQKFIMTDKEIFKQTVVTKDYNIESEYGNHVIMMDLNQKPRFSDFFKDQGVSKIIKLNFSLPGKKETCGFFFYINDKEMYTVDDQKIFIHQASMKDDEAPPIIMVFTKYNDGLRLDKVWLFYGEKQLDLGSPIHDINEDIKKFVNCKINTKK